MRPILEGHVAVVTGAGSGDGIGFATARLFVEAGGKVLLADLDGATTRELAGELGPGAIGCELDVTDVSACGACGSGRLSRGSAASTCS
jgi:NAD(P)-dependent dehydrogenase (short-subunit alcohol dehydrogenase family)